MPVSRDTAVGDGFEGDWHHLSPLKYLIVMNKNFLRRRPHASVCLFQDRQFMDLSSAPLISSCVGLPPEMGSLGTATARPVEATVIVAIQAGLVLKYCSPRNAASSRFLPNSCARKDRGASVA